MIRSESKDDDVNASNRTAEILSRPETLGASGMPTRILAIGGSTRSGSTSEVALRLACRGAQEAGAEIEFIVGRDLMLPIYDTEEDYRTANSSRLVEALARADGIIVASPGYHGSVSGMIKNALDYSEDLRRLGHSYLDGKAFGCISVAYGWQAAVTALQHLRGVAHALRAWPTPLGVALNSAVIPIETVEQDPTNAHGLQLRTVGTQVVEFAQAMRAYQRMDLLEARPTVVPLGKG